MTTYRNFGEGSYDNQDSFAEAHVWGEKTYPGAGAIIKVRGNDTEDQEAEVVYAGGTSFKLPKDANAEVYLISSGYDSQLKLAIETPPKDKQRRWMEKTGGIQHPMDPEHVLEFNDTRAHITKDAFAVGPKGTFEVKDGKVYIRGDVVIEGTATVNKEVKSPVYNTGSSPIPGLQNPAKQDSVKSDSGSKPSGQQSDETFNTSNWVV